ncbi:hypothetical protein SYNTR_1232 [Candidatus Syntrophocurvum alkaliphilum]|uniref:Alkaline shock protein n=1 Tax=Candidatus Syntrophocurvum alkaliphilum TaxID=2293317 RepID=A0A6I6DAV2_9FIRM|nr:Asp23/Gls24 family envelope stress response protein [Candidatus Syntrophocurvum alkaliphilum]QGT99825.1 hypothetical protein SYNTR_1232 [Candidatus Syntrophocurvum alkaliphilum]
MIVKKDLGDIVIDEAVFIQIAQESAKEVEGVTLVSDFIGDVGQKIGVSTNSKRATKVKEEGENIAIALNCEIDYGFNIPEKVKELQEVVGGTITGMTDTIPSVINVNVLKIKLYDNSRPTG